MTETTRKKTISWLILTAGFGLAGWLLLYAYGFCGDLSTLLFWRDHPFDLGNILFTLDSTSFSSRLWAYDPLHMFGWTPNVFYNPLATLLGALFVGLGGATTGAYIAWLLILLFSTSLVFVLFISRDNGRLAWIVGGFTGAWLSLVVYPMDVGLLDANPVQVLYTGQWAQRLGIVFGLLAILRFYQALQFSKDSLQKTVWPVITTAMFWGASLFSHYMSGYATGAALFVLCVFARSLSPTDLRANLNTACSGEIKFLT